MTDAEYAALPREVYVAVDVGGTNTRVNVGSVRGTVRVVKFESHAKSTLLQGLDAAGRLLREKAPHVTIVGASVCLAGPVLAGRSACSITNYVGDDKVVTLAEFPPSLFPPGKLLLLNDLEATCYGLIALQQPESTRKLTGFFETAWGAGAPALQPDRKYCVLAVGTGLGSAAILWSADLRAFTVVPLEAGHTFVPSYGDANPLREEERLLFAFLAEQHSHKQHPPEYESFASGKGLSHLYEWTSGGKKLAAADVAKLAVAGTDAAADKALLLHYRYLVRCAQNLCVTLLLKDGIFWAGDNGVANAAWIRRHEPELRQEFLHHHKAEWIAETPLFIQTVQTNFNLIGAIYQAELVYPRPV